MSFVLMTASGALPVLSRERIMLDTLRSSPPAAVLEGLRREEMAGMRLMTLVRCTALGVVLCWLVLRVTGVGLVYYGTIVALLAVLGLVQFVASRREGFWPRATVILLVFLDMALLTMLGEKYRARLARSAATAA